MAVETKDHLLLQYPMSEAMETWKYNQLQISECNEADWVDFEKIQGF